MYDVKKETFDLSHIYGCTCRINMTYSIIFYEDHFMSWYAVAGTLGHFFFVCVGSQKSYVILMGGHAKCLRFYLQGGREGGQKSTKPAYVIHGCSLMQTTRPSQAYSNLDIVGQIKAYSLRGKFKLVEDTGIWQGKCHIDIINCNCIGSRQLKEG